MLTDFRHDWHERMLAYFPERQIYIRSGGEVSCVTISTRKQATAAAAAALVLLWCLATLLNLLWGHNPLRSANDSMLMREARLERALEDIRARESDIRRQLEEERSSFATATREFEEKHDTLAQLLTRNGKSLIGADPVRPITSVAYASNQIQMSPILRDVAPRRARRNALETKTASARPITSDFKRLDATQNTFLASAEADTLDRIERSRAILKAAEIDVTEILQLGPMGKGGPAVDASVSPDVDSGFGSRIASIKARVSEAEALEAAMAAVPFGNPVNDDHYRTSAFGMRRDPFTKRPTFHEGMDFGGRKMSKIVSTADGTVTFVGRNGGYGRSVEIDHGHGFVTRYAHLEKTFVKRGDTVKKGQRIAGMGSTGRSTATHLHYEVHFQGRVYDPVKFLKAGLYVQ